MTVPIDPEESVTEKSPEEDEEYPYVKRYHSHL